MRLLFAARLFVLLASVPAFGARPKLYVVTHVDLMPNYADDGTQLLQKYAADSRKEKGIVRFELLARYRAEEPFHDRQRLGESGRLRRAPGGRSHQAISRKATADAGKPI